MTLEKVIIDYSGWIAVDKNDIKIEDVNGNKIDTDNLSAQEISDLLTKGKAILTSFGETHLQAVDGEDDWTYSYEVDDED